MAIKHKIALSFSLLLTGVMACFWLALKLQIDQTLARQTDALGEILSQQTADAVTELVLANDLLGLNVVLNQLAQQQGIARVVITDVDGVVLAATATRSTIAGAAGKPYVAPVSLQEAVAGNVILYLDDALTSNPLARPDSLFFLIAGAGLLLIVIASWVLAAHVTRPLKALLASTGLDDPDEEVDVVVIDRDDEIGLLQQRFADLVYRQRELEYQIEDAGIPTLDAENMTGLKAERRMATMLVVQVANSSTAIELLHPATLSTLLQQYQFYLRQAARLYRGVVTRIDGDMALVTFDTRRCQDEHAFDAFCCAQLFLRLMRQIGAAQRARNAQSLEFRLAIHSGDVYFSPVWIKAQPGDDTARPESVIGKPVDLATDLLQHCDTGEILVSELSYDLAEGHERFATDVSKRLTLATDNLQLTTYSLLPETGAYSELLERQCRHLLPEQSSQ